MKQIKAFLFAFFLVVPCLYAQDTTLTVTSGGNVGVGTTSPTQKLQVAGTVYSTSGGFKFPDGTTQASAASGTGGGIGGSGTTNYLPIFTGATTLGNSVVYETGGKVGIGTNTPSAKLDVAGSVKIADGNQAAGKVLTSSDGTGAATWQTPAIPRGTAIAYGWIGTTDPTTFRTFGITAISHRGTGDYVITVNNAAAIGNLTAICTIWDTNIYGFISYYHADFNNDIYVKIRNSSGALMDATFSIAVFGRL